jgi:AbrB family looped-hinge helix DNA binding protein
MIVVVLVLRVGNRKEIISGSRQHPAVSGGLLAIDGAPSPTPRLPNHNPLLVTRAALTGLASTFKIGAEILLPFTMPDATMNGMTLKIDKAGRIILPKPVRDRLQLREGSELDLEEHPDGVTLRPVEQKSSMLLLSSAAGTPISVLAFFRFRGRLGSPRSQSFSQS